MYLCIVFRNNKRCYSTANIRIIYNIYKFCHDCNKVLTIERENIDIAGHHSPQAGERHPSASRTECRTPSTARQVTSQTGDTAHGQPQGCTRPATEPQPPIAQKTLPVGRATAYHSQTVGPSELKRDTNSHHTGVGILHRFTFHGSISGPAT